MISSKIEKYEGDIGALMPLLMLADPDEGAIGKYIDDCDIYVLISGGRIVCEAAMYPKEGGEIELKNLATEPEEQGKGHARTLVYWLFDRYSGEYEFMSVGTTGPALYEKFGFKYSHTLKNFFIDNYSEPIFEDGVQAIDMIYLKKEL